MKTKLFKFQIKLGKLEQSTYNQSLTDEIPNKIKNTASPCNFMTKEFLFKCNNVKLGHNLINFVFELTLNLN